MNIGLIGCGEWGKFILRDLVKLRCRVTVMAVDNQSRQYAWTYGAIRVVSAISEVAKQDGYIICTPSNMRYNLIQQLVALDPECLVFAEKPLCADAGEAERLEQQMPNSLFVMDKWRYHAGIIALKELIESNEFGRIHYISIRRLSCGTLYSDIDSVWLLAPHDLSIVIELLDYLPEPVFARLDVTDSQIRGLQACLGTKPYVMLSISDRHHTTVREVMVYFERAVATLSNSHETCITIYPTQNISATHTLEVEKRPFDLNEPLYDELQAFLEFIAHGGTLKSSVADGAMEVKTLARLLELAQS